MAGSTRQSQALVMTYTYFVAIPAGVLLPDNAALCEINEDLQIAEPSGDDQALGLARLTNASSAPSCPSSTFGSRSLGKSAETATLPYH